MAEIIPDNLHRIMPAKGENTAPPTLFRKRNTVDFCSPRIFSTFF
jgi:hypothetical protein